MKKGNKTPKRNKNSARSSDYGLSDAEEDNEVDMTSIVVNEVSSKNAGPGGW